MREGRPSQTASLVALLRTLADHGYTTAKGFSDPFAAELLTPRWRWWAGFFERRLAAIPADGRDKALAQLDPIPLRVMQIDAEIASAVDAGARQLVILGAGLDTRAYRLTSLKDVDVYEVDHPSTQAYKRDAAARLQPVSKHLVYVPVDFERQRLVDELAAAGHRADVPTVWVWEGVIMYLTDDALRTTLAGVLARSAPGSRLVAHYHEPGRRDASWVRWLTRYWGEPQIGERPKEVMREELERAGFAVDHDTGAKDWAATFGAQTAITDSARISRIVVARVP